MTKKDLRSHWNEVYERSPVSKLGWYEEDPEPSLGLIRKYCPDKAASILNVGAGASVLVDRLLQQGYQQVIANDLSVNALTKLRERLGKAQDQVAWVIDDLTQPKDLLKLSSVDLWHDRAVLHFFTAEADQASYFRLLRSILAGNGLVIIAAFNLKGADKCSGLPVHRYDIKMLKSGLGDEFELLEAFDYTYTMPSGDSREYIYTVFRRKR